MSEPDFTGFGQTIQATFRPQFVEVERRVGQRRRRSLVAGAAVVVAAVAAGAAVVASTGLIPGGARDGAAGATQPMADFIPMPRPMVSPGSSGPGVGVGHMVAGDLHHLYWRYSDCQAGNDCAIGVAATADGGANWRSMPMPVPKNSLVILRVVGPRTLVAEVQTGRDTGGATGPTATPVAGSAPAATDESPQGSEGERDHFWLTSTDGAVNWRKVDIREVAAIPAGFRVLDYPPDLESLTVLAADPGSGDIVRLAKAVPLRWARLVQGASASAGLWVTGYTGHAIGPIHEEDGSTSLDKYTFTGSAVAVSRDGGRNWHQVALPEEVRASDGAPGAAAVAVSAEAAYAVGQVDGELRVYRSTDMGNSWQRTAARAQVGNRTIEAGVRADGALLIQAGIVAGEDPLMFVSVDRGESVREVEAGPGASAVAVAGGYAQSGNPDDGGAWISRDGVSWSHVAPPAIR